MKENVDWPTIGLTVREAAQALRVAEATIRTLLKKGDLPGRKVGRSWRIDEDAVRKWLAKGGNNDTEA